VPLPFLKRLLHIARYGVGPEARARKQADKRRRKAERFGSAERWQQDSGFVRRRYDSYEDYVQHQASKLDGVIDRLRETDEEVFRDFQERFAGCAALAGMRSVLCLGARLGTEVRALHALGHFAVGIDLNPGPENRYVLPGDFHGLVFPAGSVDAVYSNALDHVFDLDRMVSEVARVIRPGGVFLAEFEVGFEEGHVPGDFEATHWKDSQLLIERIRDAAGLAVETVTELGQTRRGRRRLVVFRKSEKPA
jgi:SAM-dependent methyltransferase